MKQNTLLVLVLANLLLLTRPMPAAERLDLDRFADPTKLIPISLSGFTGEVADALKFDLDVMGFTNTVPESAQYLISGSNNGKLIGRVIDRINKNQLLGQEYKDAAPRLLAHTFADDVVEKLTGKKGIARTKIAFKVDTGRNSEIYWSDYDGHNAKAATADNTIVAAPSWAPGGHKLYYTSYNLGNPDIFSQDLLSGERKVVARYSGLNTSAAISSDGNKVAMILSKAGSPDVYVGDAGGGNLKQLTKTKEDESSPCWSPDGRTLCFSSRATGRAALYKISVDGGEMRRLRTDGVGGNLTEPDWSPDGKTIVFTSQTGGFDICTVPAEGGAATVLVSGEDPSWAPNSRTVIFTRRVNNRRVLSLLDVPTKRVKDVARVSGSCSQPSWAK